MATITQTLNANAIWNGTVPFDADPTVTDIVLYAANVDQNNAYRRVCQITNAGPGPNALGGVSGLTYARLFLQNPARPFFLRATQMRGAVEDNITIAANPVLAVTPSSVIGWTLGQLLEQDVRPVMIVGYNVANKMFYPVNVVPGAGGGFKLE